LRIADCEVRHAQRRIRNGEEEEKHMQTTIIKAKPVDVTDATFETEVLKSPVPVLLDCWAPWCGPCQRMTPIMQELAADLTGHVKVAKLNVDQNPAVSRQLAIQSIPTILLFRDGQALAQTMGAVPKEELKAAVLARLNHK
jgi:thioredoxin 2